MVYDYYRTNFVTAKTALIETVKVGGFSAPRIMPPGSNIQYFVETVVNGPGRTWKVMKFDFRRSLLSLIHYLLELYYAYHFCFWKEVVRESFVDLSPSLSAPIHAVSKGYYAYKTSSKMLLEDVNGIDLPRATSLIKDTFSGSSHANLPQHVSTIISYNTEQHQALTKSTGSELKTPERFWNRILPVFNNGANTDYKSSFKGALYKEQGIIGDLKEIDAQLQKILKDTSNFIYWCYKLGIAIVSVYEALGKLVESWQELATMISHLLKNGEVINLVIPAIETYVQIQSGSFVQLAKPLKFAVEKEAVAIILKLGAQKHTRMFKAGNFLEQPITRGASLPNDFIGERVSSESYMRVLQDIFASTMASESELTYDILQKLVVHRTMGVEKSPDLIVQFSSDSFLQGYPVYCLKNATIWNNDSGLFNGDSPSLLRLVSALKDFSKSRPSQSIESAE